MCFFLLLVPLSFACILNHCCWVHTNLRLWYLPDWNVPFISSTASYLKVYSVTLGQLQQIFLVIVCVVYLFLHFCFHPFCVLICIYLFIQFWLCWIFVATHRLSLVVARGATLRCSVRASHLRWLLLLQSVGSRRMGFSSCSTWAQ